LAANRYTNLNDLLRLFRPWKLKEMQSIAKIATRRNVTSPPPAAGLLGATAAGDETGGKIVMKSLDQKLA